MKLYLRLTYTPTLLLQSDDGWASELYAAVHPLPAAQLYRRRPRLVKSLNRSNYPRLQLHYLHIQAVDRGVHQTRLLNSRHSYAHHLSPHVFLPPSSLRYTSVLCTSTTFHPIASHGKNTELHKQPLPNQPPTTRHSTLPKQHGINHQPTLHSLQPTTSSIQHQPGSHSSQHFPLHATCECAFMMIVRCWWIVIINN